MRFENITNSSIYRAILSVTAGLLCLVFAKYNISYQFENLSINIPWSLLFPIIVSAAFGTRFAVISAISGGALFPVLLWPSNGYALIVDVLSLFVLIVLVGYVANLKKSFQRLLSYRILVGTVVLGYLIFLFSIYYFGFNSLLSFNPTFWTDSTVTSLPNSVILTIIIKCAFNYLLIVIFSDTLLMLSEVRVLFGLKVERWMKQNSRVFLLSLLIALVVWTIFYLLDILLSSNKQVDKDYIELSFMVLFLSSGIIGWVLIFYNNSKYFAEARLQSKQQQLVSIINNIPSVVYRCSNDENWTIQMISPQISEITGYPVNSSFFKERRSFTNLLYQEDRSKVEDSIKQQIALNNAFQVDYRIISSTGTIHWISEVGRLYFDEDNLSGYIDGVINDITTRKLLELEVEQYRNNLEQLVKQRTKELEIANEELKATLEQLNKTQFQLIQSEKMASLGILTAGFAHEINNPLNFIMGGYSALQEMVDSGNIDNQDAKLLLTGIKEGVTRAAEIVKLLNQISANNNIFSKSCDIHRILDNCVTILHYITGDKIEVLKKYSSEISCIEGNTGQLHQAFLNILLNAIQAIDNKGSITITTQRTDDRVKIDISDTGCGISSENLSKIVDPFFTTKSPGKGTGLGLTICYSIVTEHRGTIEFMSEENKGTTVSITFPLVN